MHFHVGDRGRGCGPRGGGWGGGRRSWGPIEVEWSFGPGGGEGAPRGRARRMFDGGELRLVLLALISDAPRHGYDLIREIEERTGGGYAPSPGVVYPTLTLLSDMGLIEEQAAEGAKKLYAITPAGTQHLEERAEEVARLMGRLAEIGAVRERSDRGPVRRAMGNLKAALRAQLHGSDDPELAHQVAAILDEAVQKIERLK
jgi:DNA-binding PadR family transcriptional regulator